MKAQSQTPIPERPNFGEGNCRIVHLSWHNHSRALGALPNPPHVAAFCVLRLPQRPWWTRRGGIRKGLQIPISPLEGATSVRQFGISPGFRGSYSNRAPLVAALPFLTIKERSRSFSEISASHPAHCGAACVLSTWLY